MIEVSGTLVMTSLKKRLTATQIERILLAEQYLNDKVASELFVKFGYSLRVHLSGDKPKVR